MDENKVTSPENRKQEFSSHEVELIQQLIQSRMGRKQEMVIYEELDEYEVPPRTQFSMLSKPAVTIKDGQLNFNMASIRLFENVQHILPVINEKKHRLAVIPCVEEEMSSIDWARKRADDTWTNKQITNRDLVNKIGTFMKWSKDCRYKILGEVRLSARGPILVFELDEAIQFVREDVEYLDEETGEVKIKKKDIKFYPEKYKGKIGMSYSEYAEARQMSLFEDFTNYFGQDGTVVANEPADMTEETILQDAGAEVAEPIQVSELIPQEPNMEVSQLMPQPNHPLPERRDYL